MSAGGVDPIEGVPHGAPVLLIDRLLEAAPDRAVAECLFGEGPWSDGEEVWELALVEGLAQTAAAMVSAERRRRGERAPSSGMLVGLKRFEWKRRARIGERLEFRVELVKSLPPLAVVEGIAAAGLEEIARGELKFFVELDA